MLQNMFLHVIPVELHETLVNFEYFFLLKKNQQKLFWNLQNFMEKFPEFTYRLEIFGSHKSC